MSTNLSKHIVFGMPWILHESERSFISFIQFCIGWIVKLMPRNSGNMKVQFSSHLLRFIFVCSEIFNFEIYIVILPIHILSPIHIRKGGGGELVRVLAVISCVKINTRILKKGTIWDAVFWTNRNMTSVASLRFSCSVCSKDYTESGDHVPKLLPCTHTVCGHCVENKLFQYFESRSSLDCPVCGKEHHYCEGVKLVPENQYIKVIIRQNDGDVHKEGEFDSERSLENGLEALVVELESLKKTCISNRRKIEALKMENNWKSYACNEQIELAREQTLKRLNKQYDKLVAEENERKIKVETKLHDAAEKVKDEVPVEEVAEEDVTKRLQAVINMKSEMTNIMSDLGINKYFKFRTGQVSDTDLCNICGSLIQENFQPQINLQETTATGEKDANHTGSSAPRKRCRAFSTTGTDKDVNSTGSPASDKDVNYFPTPKKARKETASPNSTEKDVKCAVPMKTRKNTASRTTNEKGVNSTGSLTPRKGQKETASTNKTEKDVNSTGHPVPMKTRKNTVSKTTKEKGVNSTGNLTPKKSQKETASTNKTEKDVNSTGRPVPMKTRKNTASKTTNEKGVNSTGSLTPKKSQSETASTTNTNKNVNSTGRPVPIKSCKKTTSTTNTDKDVKCTGSLAPRKSHKETASRTNSGKDVNSTRSPGNSRKETASTATSYKDGNPTGHLCAKEGHKETVFPTNTDKNVKSLGSLALEKKLKGIACTTTSGKDVSSIRSPPPKRDA